MKKIFLILILILSLFSLSLAKKAEAHKIIIHSSIDGLNVDKYSVIIIPEYFTLTKIDSKKINVKDSIILIASGIYSFQSKQYKSHSKSFSFEIESNKFYILDAYKNPNSFDKTSYILVELSKEAAENHIYGNYYFQD